VIASAVQSSNLWVGPGWAGNSCLSLP